MQKKDVRLIFSLYIRKKIYFKTDLFRRTFSSIFTVKQVESETILGEFCWFDQVNVYVAEVISFQIFYGIYHKRYAETLLYF